MIDLLQYFPGPNDVSDNFKCNRTAGIRCVMFVIGLPASDSLMCGRTDMPMDVRTSAKCHPKLTL